MVVASSLQVVDGHQKDQAGRVIGVEDGPTPQRMYALTKVWAEEMGRLYAQMSDMTVLAVRIGFYPRGPAACEKIERRRQGTNCVLSHRDANRFFERCVACDPPPQRFNILFAVSKQADEVGPRFDLEPARRVIGYEPTDRYPQGITFDTD